MSSDRRNPAGGSGSNLLQYKGYLGKVEFDAEAEFFFGEVINTRDVITFQGTCVADLRQAFEESIEDYLDFCAQRGEEPEKPFSGRILLRIDPELHRRITIAAKKKDLSLNQWLSQLLDMATA
jgi:predicted HicB family RNase H-like nuclease